MGWITLDYQIELMEDRMKALKRARTHLSEPPVPLVASNDYSRLEMYVTDSDAADLNVWLRSNGFRLAVTDNSTNGFESYAVLFGPVGTTVTVTWNRSCQFGQYVKALPPVLVG